MMNSYTLKPLLVLFLTVLAATGASFPAWGQTTWNNANNGALWSTSGNWDNGVPDAAGATANLDYALNGNFVGVNLGGGAVTVGTLNIGTTDGITGGIFDLQNGSLVMNNSGNSATITDISTASSAFNAGHGGFDVGDEFDVPITLADNLNIITNSQAGKSTLVFWDGPITGTGNLTLTVNSVTNTVNSPAIAIQTGTTLDNIGSVTIAGSTTNTVFLMGGATSNVTNIIQNSANTTGVLWGGTFNNQAVTVQVGTLQINSGVNGGGISSFVVGDTAAHSGSSARLNNINTLGLSTGKSLSGFGQVLGSVSTSSGTILTPGSLGNIGTLSINTNLTLAGGTVLNFDLGTATGSPATSLGSELAIGGTLSLPGSSLTLNLSDNAGANGQGSLGAGVYELASYNALSGASAGDITSLFNITAPAGFSYALSDTGTGAGQIDLSVTAMVTAPEPGSWGLMLAGLGLLGGFKRLRQAGLRTS